MRFAGISNRDKWMVTEGNLKAMANEMVSGPNGSVPLISMAGLE